jgi:hypothetical protein
MKIRLNIPALIALLLISLTAVSCGDMRAPSRDNGDSSFVRQAVPKILGRRFRSYDELRFYTEFAAIAGRDAVLEVMFRHPPNQEDYIRHWSEILVDHMRVNREGQKSLQSCYPEPSDAIESDALAQWVLSHDANESYPGGSFTMTELLQSSIALDDLSPFFRAHLYAMWNKPLEGAEVREQNRQRDLSDTFHQAYLSRSMDCIPCHNSANSVTGEGSAWNRHFPIQGDFEKALYGSHIGPLAPDSSEVFPEAVWWTFRTDKGDDNFAGTAVCDGSLAGAERPFGMSGSCARLGPKDSLASCDGGGESCLCLPTYEDAGGATVTDAGSFLGMSARTRSIWDVEEMLRDGIGNNRRGLTRTEAEGRVAGAGFCASDACADAAADPGAGEEAARTALAAEFGDSGCTGCHGVGGNRPQLDDADLLYDELVGWAYGTAYNSDGVPLVIPGESGAVATDRGMLWRLVQTDVMPLGGGLGATPKTELLAALTTWAGELASTAGCEICGEASEAGVLAEMLPEDALAGLAAQTVVDRVWQTIFGSRLRLVHDFSRTSPQGRWLLLNAELAFGRTWSLRDAITTVVRNGNFFNRPAPFDSGLATLAENYELPLVLDPWVAADPRRPPVAEAGWEAGGPAPIPEADYDAGDHPDDWFNGMGDAIHRRQVRTILNSAATGLGWPEPERFPNEADFFSRGIASGLGQFLTDAEQGADRLSFEGLLGWDGVAATCDAALGADWIDALVDAAVAAPRVTYRDVSDTLHGRLINRGTPEESEDVVAGIFGLVDAGDLDDEVGAPASLAPALRELCGGVLISPQFLLAGMEPPELGDRHALGACLPGEPCGFVEICEEIVAAGVPASLGIRLICPRTDTGRLRVSWRDADALDLRRLCPRGNCSLMPWFDDAECAEDPRACLPPFPPGSPIGCDPRCYGEPMCCGRMPRNEMLTRDGLLVAPAAGGLVRKVSGVQRLPAQSESGFTTLQKGDVLEAGDILRFEVGSVFKARTPMGGMRTKRKGLAGKRIISDSPGQTRDSTEQQRGPWMMLVAEAMAQTEMEFPFDDLLASDTPAVVQTNFLESGFYRWGLAGRTGLSTDVSGCKRTAPIPGDGIDNDCDGRIDEEILNGVDDDGDPLTDEDLSASQGSCPGKFGDFDGVSLFGSGGCEISFTALSVDCPVLRMKPFGESDFIDFEMVAGSSELAAATNVPIGGTPYNCEMLFDGTQGPSLALLCQNSSGSCSDIFYPAP